MSWDRNAYYHQLLLDRLPSPCRHVLDVGCGAGSFAARLADRAEHVDALDRSPDMIQAAQDRVPSNVTCIEADVMEALLPPGHYDAITSISTLHHLPLADALGRLSASLRPGGVLACTSLSRSDLPREIAIEGLAWGARMSWAAAQRGDRLLRGRGRQEAEHDPPPEMPMMDPQLTVRQIRQQAAAVLPEVRVRRLLFWRYLLLWRKP